MGNLFDKIIESTNLYLAADNIKCNGAKAVGIDGILHKDAERYLDSCIEEVVQSLKDDAYYPQPIKQVVIPKPNGGIRQIGIPSLMDKIIQLAIVNIISPIYEKKFSDYSYGFREKRNIHQAIIKAKEYMNDGYDYVVAMDLSKYFDTIHHDRLMSVLFQDIKDEKLLRLIRLFLQSEILYHGNKVDTEPNRGTIQGGNLSPLLANIYLDKLDWELSLRKIRFIRYADDITLFAKDRKSAEMICKDISKFIEAKLFLTVNKTKTTIAQPTDIKLLGFNFYRDNQEYKSCIPEESINRMTDKLRDRIDKSKSIEMAVKVVNDELQGWTANYIHADRHISNRQTKDIDRIILERLYKRFKPDTDIGKFKGQLSIVIRGQIKLISMHKLWKQKRIKGAITPTDKSVS